MDGGDGKDVDVDGGDRKDVDVDGRDWKNSVSYTHLTLPTRRTV